MVRAEVSPDAATFCRRVSLGLSVGVALVSVTVLFGWAFDIGILTSVFPGFATMKINAAISLFCLALALFAPWKPARLLCIVPILMGSLTLMQYLFQADFGIDQMIIQEAGNAPGTSNPGRMSPLTAFNFILLGFAAALSHMNIRGRIVEFIVAIPFVISLTALIGYIFDVKQFYGIAGYTKMAIYTSISFLLLCAALILANPERPLCSFVAGRGVGSRTMRRMLIPFVAVLVLISWLTVRGMKMNLYVPEFGVSLVIISAILILAFMFWLNGRSLNKYENEITRHAEEMTLAYETIRRSEDHVQVLNSELEKKLAELADAYKELETFSYSVSHDLRAPVRAIDGFSRILLEDYAKALDDEGKRILGVIVANTKNMGQLIEDLLEFSRCGRKELSMSLIDMEALAHEAADGVCGRFSLVVEKLPKATGDYAMIKQVFANLISNAAKFSSKKPQPSIEIGSRHDGPQIIYYVKDNGAGFDMKYVGKLFGIFQRLHSSAEFEGTGVGLAIVQRIVQRHGGRVWAEGKVDCGATFYFSLPYKGEAHGN